MYGSRVRGIKDMQVVVIEPHCFCIVVAATFAEVGQVVVTWCDCVMGMAAADWVVLSGWMFSAPIT